MSRTVIILGAGFSFDAGIPLLGNFIERMEELLIYGRVGDVKLTDPQKHILSEALDVRKYLDTYHGRANFDDRNIEDLLSLLAISNQSEDLERLAVFQKAIALTLELTCSIKHSGIPRSPPFDGGTVDESGSAIYKSFWQSLLSWRGAEAGLPTILTMNYDLVLERSLLQVLNGSVYDQSTLPLRSILIDYGRDDILSQGFDVVASTQTRFRRDGTYSAPKGTIMKPADRDEYGASANILKLHGSVNFPRNTEVVAGGYSEFDLVSPVDDPLIVPPVSNKSLVGELETVWSSALSALRGARNVVIVGYSLPKSDTYFQYFLKSALGPNLELSRIQVFDPILSTDTQGNLAMRERYQSCFSSQLQSRIQFSSEITVPGREQPGTTNHFVRLLAKKPGSLLS